MKKQTLPWAMVAWDVLQPAFWTPDFCGIGTGTKVILVAMFGRYEDF